MPPVEAQAVSDADQQIARFLKLHIPEGTTEYAPAGADEVQCGAVVAEHFQAVAAEETLLLDRMARRSGGWL